jgi:hypothetical protein
MSVSLSYEQQIGAEIKKSENKKRKKNFCPAGIIDDDTIYGD